MWIKFCGICRPTDFHVAVELGVDAIGLIMVPSSPRCLNTAELEQLSALPRAQTKLVLVIQDQSPELIAQAIAIAKPSALQFHGSESPPDCERYNLPYIKATRASTNSDLVLLHEHKAAWAWLIDRRPHAQIDRAVIDLRAQFPSQRIIEAGGLTPANVTQRIKSTLPFGVDVSSGIESKPRIKSRLTMEQFISAVRHAGSDKL